MKLINIEDEGLLKSLSDGGRSAKQVTKLFMKQPTIEAIPIEWLIEYGKKRTINIRDIFIIIDDWREENGNA